MEFGEGAAGNGHGVGDPGNRLGAGAPFVRHLGKVGEVSNLTVYINAKQVAAR